MLRALKSKEQEHHAKKKHAVLKPFPAGSLLSPHHEILTFLIKKKEKMHRPSKKTRRRDIEVNYQTENAGCPRRHQSGRFRKAWLCEKNRAENHARARVIVARVPLVVRSHARSRAFGLAGSRTWSRHRSQLPNGKRRLPQKAPKWSIPKGLAMREKPRRKPCARACHRGSCPSRRAVSCTVASIRSSWQSNVEPSSKSIAKRKTPAAPEGTKVVDSERHGYARKTAPKTMRARVSS